MALLFGLDSGGTKTLAAIADESGEIIRFAAAGSLDPMAVPEWRDRLATLVTELTAGLVEPLSAAVLGLPFHGEIDEVAQAQIDASAELFDCTPIVENDVRIAFDGAFAGAGGVLVLAGTGSMAWASRGGPGARQVRTGGWGDLFGDEGSAYWIGREALARVSQELDGRIPETGFSSGLLSRLGIPANDLMGWLYRQDSPRRGIAGVARFVSQLAEQGDPVAAALLDQAADHLAVAARAAWRQAAGSDPLRWSYAGGVLQSTTVLARLTECLGAPPTPGLLPPVGGALLRAKEALGSSADPAWVARLSNQLDAKLRQ